ncbi:cell envelope protein [Mycolicibacter heraklionensis]|uniref:Cell envelope protein n=1 Tax=Mycolicibacter heraklionensis TaxID=512402 RepID=A0AA91IYZ0_9MYCO|nr:cell envelope protein [Mycolicibacter heraklionensis]
MLAAVGGCGSRQSAEPVGPAPATSADQVRQIAKEAYVYGFPMVDSYRIQHAYFVDKAGSQYKGDWNQTHSAARVYTPDDTAVQTPNSDTPYTMLGADLRAEPLVLTVPPIEAGRYYSLQFIDAYTYNFAYVGSRTTGNGGGTYLLAGPGWSGEKPEGVDEVIRSETDFALVIYRTQLFDPADIDNVKKIQAGYTVEPLSAYLKQPAVSAPPVDFIAPLTPDEQKTSPKFFEILNFLLKYAPVLPGEQDLRTRFAGIGIGPDGTFSADELSAEARDAVQAGMADAWAELNAFKKDKLDTGQVTSGQLFGTREFLAGNYLYRMAGAVLGIYGNSQQEAIYPVVAVDSDGAPLSGAGGYTLRFAPEALPPVNSFWSLTMYKMPESLLVANPINRYLINSPMLPDLTRDPDGGITVYVQNQSPGAAKESNWLPAPQGPFQMILRLYWPKEEALNGSWAPPKAVKN